MQRNEDLHLYTRTPSFSILFCSVGVLRDTRLNVRDIHASDTKYKDPM